MGVVIVIWLMFGFAGACFSIAAFKRTGGAKVIDYMFFFTVGLLGGPAYTAMGVAYWLDAK